MLTLFPGPPILTSIHMFPRDCHYHIPNICSILGRAELETRHNNRCQSKCPDSSGLKSVLISTSMATSRGLNSAYWLRGTSFPDHTHSEPSTVKIQLQLGSMGN